MIRRALSAPRAIVALVVLSLAATAGWAQPVARSSGKQNVGAKTERRLLRGMRHGARVVPDMLYSRGSRLMVDASHVNGVQYRNLQLVPLKEIFSNPKATFIGFGTPNTYLTVPREAGDAKGSGWNKFAAFMFWRKPAYIADTKGRVQGGLLVELRGLPEAARSALRSSMEAESGRCRVSCANSNARVLEEAGFELGGKTKLSEILLPSRLAREIWEHGLRYRGKEVHLRFIATYEGSTQDHFGAVIQKQISAPVRAIRKIATRSDRSAAPLIEPRRLGPAVAAIADHSSSVELRMGRPSRLGAALSRLWGEHPLYSAVPDRKVADIDGPEYRELHDSLAPFPGERSRVDRLKVTTLGGSFGRALRDFMAKPQLDKGGRIAALESLGSVPGSTVVKMLRPGGSGDPFLYNLVVTGGEIRIARLENRTHKDSKVVNWLLAKHILISGNSRDVRFAGEIWVEDTTAGRVVHINNNSGTYQPSNKRVLAMARFLENTFAVKVVAHDRDGASLGADVGSPEK